MVYLCLKNDDHCCHDSFVPLTDTRTLVVTYVQKRHSCDIIWDKGKLVYIYTEKKLNIFYKRQTENIADRIGSKFIN